MLVSKRNVASFMCRVILIFDQFQIEPYRVTSYLSKCVLSSFISKMEAYF